MAVVYSIDNVASLGSLGKIINFPVSNKDNKDVLDFILGVEQLKKDCSENVKSSKQLLKSCNEIIAKTKKAEKAILNGKLNKSIDENVCQGFKKAKYVLQDIVNDIKR